MIVHGGTVKGLKMGRENFGFACDKDIFESILSFDLSLKKGRPFLQDVGLGHSRVLPGKVYVI